MCDRNAKSECILIKSCALVSESICERTSKLHETILFDSRVINLQTPTTKYLCFQYSVAYCSHLSGSDALWEPARRSRDRWWRRLLWAVWGIPTCSSLINVQRWRASSIEMSCLSTASASHSQPVWRLLYFSTGQRCPQGAWDGETV